MSPQVEDIVRFAHDGAEYKGRVIRIAANELRVMSGCGFIDILHSHVLEIIDPAPTADEMALSAELLRAYHGHTADSLDMLKFARILRNAGVRRAP